MDDYGNKDYYNILGISETASLANIIKAKDRLYYDEIVDFSEWNKIYEAYKVLSDPEKRKEYDKFLDQKRQGESAVYTGAESNYERKLEELPMETDSKLGKTEDIQLIPKKLSSSQIEETKEEGNNTSPEPIVAEIVEPKEEGNNTSPEPIVAEIVEPKEERNNISPEPIVAETVEPIEKDNSSDDSLNFVHTFGTKEQGPVKFDEKLKRAAKYTGIGILGTTLGGPIGLYVAIKWYKKNEKTKLQNNSTPKKMSKLSTKELEEFDKYNKNLEQQINKLLSEPHNNYRLEINRLKYENQIILQQALLDIKMSNSNSKKGKLKYKMDLVATKMHLETARNNLEKINKKIENYNGKNKLSKINEELIKTNNKLNSAIKAEERRPNNIKYLNAEKIKIFNKRDKKALRTKYTVMKSMKIYDKFLSAKDFVVSFPYIFKGKDEVDDFIVSQQVRNC